MNGTLNRIGKWEVFKHTMSHHLVTVCMFCLLCAAHTTCGAHISKFSEDNDPINIVKFNEQSSERLLPFDINFADFQTIDSTPIHDDKDHGIRKKNLSEEKKMRYLQKLSKIRSHRANSESQTKEVLAITHEEHHSDKDSVPIVISENALSEVHNSIKKRDVLEVKDKVSLRNVHPSAYVKQLFSLYGDADSMTMNVSGLNAMLRELDLMKMVEGGHVEQKKPDYVYKNGHDEEVKHTCVNSADLIKTVNSRLKQHQDHERNDAHEEPLLNEISLQAICPIILYQKLANTSHERQGCVIDRDRILSERMSVVASPSKAYTTRRVEVWVYSSLSIFAISACGLLGVAVVPIMHKNYYNHIMQFLIALAIGTLGGDAFLHLIPHALSSGHNHGGSEVAEHSHNDGMWKGLAAMMGVVFFYFTEKGLTVIAEFRKRRQKKEENKLPSRVRVLQDEGTSGCNKPISTSSTNSFLKIFNSKCKKQEDPDTKMCKHKYSEYPYCYDEITTDTHDHHHHRDGQIPPSPKMKKNNSVSVVSSNNLTEKENEPTAKDWLLNYMDDDKTKDSAQKDGVEMNNIKHKDGEVSKDPKDEESYTVILREHSRAHHGHSHSHGHVHAPPSSLSSVVWMVIMGDGLHNFTDGMAIGAAFASNIAVGFSTAIAVLCHELPHELGDFAVLLKAGMSVRRAIFYNILSSVLCVAGMVCGVLVGHAPAATSWVFAVAAGLFIYIALADLVPELSSSHSKEGTFCQCMLQLFGLCTGIGIMLLIALYEHDLESLFG